MVVECKVGGLAIFWGYQAIWGTWVMATWGVSGFLVGEPDITTLILELVSYACYL